jgi:hypothetical protein
MRCTCGIYSKNSTICKVIYSADIQFWPIIHISLGLARTIHMYTAMKYIQCTVLIAAGLLCTVYSVISTVLCIVSLVLFFEYSDISTVLCTVYQYKCY